jgi:dihydrofolate synthase/folylpolyglutamate synthase
VISATACHDGSVTNLAAQTTDDSRRQDALDWLLGRINYERTIAIPYPQRQLKLDRMRQLLNRCGNPDVGMKIVHVAGTKGKGSTSAFVAAVLQAAGYRTGVFSSPHLERIEERFTVDGAACTAAEFVDLVDRMRPVARTMDEEASHTDSDGPTYFELTTAMALQHFADRQVDVAVLEVGLGGRLDATNVCLPAVAVITSISHDHTRQLGNTLAQIAREKAGIIKPGVPVISGVTDEEPRQAIAEVAREHGCRLVELERHFQVQYESRPQHSSNDRWRGIQFRFDAAPEACELINVRLGMFGRHQAANAAVAIATLLELRKQGWSISEESIRLGLASARLPARVEFFPGRPSVVVDTAHNPASARALAETLQEEFPPGRRTLLLSISRDKDVKSIVAALVPHFDRFVVTEFQENPRAVGRTRLGALVRAQLGALGWAGEVLVCDTPPRAWEQALASAAEDELVVIAGSFFLAAELRPLVLEHFQPRAPLASSSPL